MDVPDLERLSREHALRKAMREALLVFSRSVSAHSSIATALEQLAGELAGLLGARTVSVWLYDRQTRVLTLAGSSDPRDTATATPLREDDDSAIAAALRRDQPELTGTGPTEMLVAPLRGWRRALGTLVVEGQPRHVTTEQFVDVLRDFAPLLSLVLENLQVLEEMIRQHARKQADVQRNGGAERLAALGQVVAGIAHELNNPLQGVLGHTERLLSTVPPKSALRADLRRIHDDADRAAKIVRNLLVFAGARRLTKRRVDVARVVGKAVALRDGVPDRGTIEVVQNCQSDLPQVLGDAASLQQALLNILANAEQAIADHRRTGKILVTAMHHAGRVRITIEDDGPGIPGEIAPRVFDPFFTTKEVGKGTGLGLAITAGIVQEHNGTITAGVSPLGGAMFTIELPRAGW